MKKIFILLLTILLSSQNILTTTAATAASSSDIIYVSDDLYVEVTLEEEFPTIVTFSTSTSKTYSKTATLKNGDNETVAKFKLTATFTYDGSTSTCTNVSHSATIYDDSYEFTSTSSSKSGATATGKYTIKKYILFINTQTVSDTITIKCDKNGNIS